MVKKLHPKAFWLIISGIVAAMVYELVNTIYTLLTPDSVDYSAYYDLVGEDGVDRMKNLVFVFSIFIAILLVLFYAYFIVRLLKNRKAPAKQGYLTFLFVVNIIGLVLNAFSLFMGAFLVIINIAFNVMIISGRVIQNRYNPPQDFADNPYGNPYGSPYGNPYGNPNNGGQYGNPYNNPYDTDPFSNNQPGGNPYGNNYNNGNPYNSNPNNADPFNNNQPGGNPYGNNYNNGNPYNSNPNSGNNYNNNPFGTTPNDQNNPNNGNQNNQDN